MNPEIFTFGAIRLPVYPTFMVIAFIIGWTIGYFDAEKQGLNPIRALEAGIVSNFAGVVGARILYVILQWDNFMAYPEYIFLFRLTGLSFMGGLIGAFIGTFLWSRWRRESFFKFTDLFAVYWALGYGIVRIGCFFGGCCFGKVTDLPWAVTMVRVDDLPRHPVQLYATLLAFTGVLILLMLRRIRPFDGFITLSAFATYGILRFTTEFFREGELFWMGLTDAQLASAALFAVSTAAIIITYYTISSKKLKGFTG